MSSVFPIICVTLRENLKTMLHGRITAAVHGGGFAALLRCRGGGAGGGGGGRGFPESGGFGGVFRAGAFDAAAAQRRQRVMNFVERAGYPLLAVGPPVLLSFYTQVKVADVTGEGRTSRLDIG
jgi:hypothetical protein